MGWQTFVEGRLGMINLHNREGCEFFDISRDKDEIDLSFSYLVEFV
jgi:hypothetical protein